jgi:hypothetical protein
MSTFYFYYVSVLALGIALAAGLAVLFRMPSAPERPWSSPVPPARPRVAAAGPAVPDDHGASEHLTRGDVTPDSILRCTIQTSGHDPDFFDGRVGSYRAGQFIRILMQNDESDDPEEYWHSWDVPWSKLVEVILRVRTTPVVATNIRQPDGTFRRKGLYHQTRLYRVGLGIECRLLDSDGSDLTDGEPYRWLKSNIGDGDVRFTQDTQEDTQYGDDGQDALDAYALYAKERAERVEDEHASDRVLFLSRSEVADLMAKRPTEIQAYARSQEYTDVLAKWLSDAQTRQSGIEPAHADYVRRIVDLSLAGVILYRFCEMFFYANFRTAGRPASEAAKAELASVVRLMVQEVRARNG